MKTKMIIAVILFAYAMAEPPVGDSYSYPDYAAQRSLSQEYGPPSFGARNQNLQISPKYGPPETQSVRLSKEYLPSQRSLSQEYGVPSRIGSDISQVYGQPNERSLQQYGVPSTRTSDASGYKSLERNSLSQSYGVPSARNLDTFDLSGDYSPSGRTLPQNYEVSNYKSFASTRNLSQKYGVPSRGIYTSVRDLSRQYGVPKSRSQNTFTSQLSNTRNLGVAHQFRGADVTKSVDASYPSDSYGAPLQRSFDSISSDYGAPQIDLNSENLGFRSQNTISQTYGAPRQGSDLSKSSRFASGAQNSVSTTYGVPRLSSQYGVPTSARTTNQKLSQTYGAPNARAFNDVSSNLKSGFTSSSYLPPARNAMPSTEYGVPDANNILSNQGYSYARNALDELINQEPANYDFGYKVNDVHTGSDFGHTETRQENKAEGSYFVVLPDGTKQVVEYEADDQGFRPRISVEAVETEGYDENAANLSRSGPY